MSEYIAPAAPARMPPIISHGSVPSFPSSHQPSAPQARKVNANCNPAPAYLMYCGSAGPRGARGAFGLSWSTS